MWTSEAFLRVSVHSQLFFSSIERDFCHENFSAKIRHTQRWGFNWKAYAPPALYLSANYHHRVSSCLVVVRESDTTCWMLDSDWSIEVQWLVPQTNFENILVQSFFFFCHDFYMEPETSIYKWLFQLDDEPNLYIGNGWKSPNIHFKTGCLGVPGCS